MADVTRRIGLSLGADLCWPICYEDIVRDMDLALEIEGDTLRFEVERVTIEPFDLQQPSRFDVILDRLTHWYHTSREWIKKAILLDDLYVLNNPWSVQSMEKQTSYCAMMRLGLPIPETILVPPKEYEPSTDLQTTLERYAKLFDIADWGSKLGFPHFMKPYDGGGWTGVSKIDDEQALREAYDKSGRFVMHLQKAILPYEEFVRGIGLGPQVRIVRYDPAAPLHERYRPEQGFLSQENESVIRDLTLTINTFFGWDFNSCESLLKDGTWHPIDFANPCPDSQVTSLHVHFPWLVKANIRWSLFCAATGRKMRQNLDWAPYYEIAEQDLPYREKLAAYATIARERLEADRFEAFCEQHLGQLDAVAVEYFGSDRAREAVRKKVQSLFPEHEWDEFTDHFWGRLQDWRAEETERIAAGPREKGD